MFLGIDLGTSSVKSVLMDAEQQILASHSAALDVSRPQDGWSEQNPSDWISAIEQTLDALRQSHPKELSAVRGIGLSGHMHGATLLDDQDQVIRPCMLWNDTRSQAQAQRLDTPQFRQIGGNILFPGFTAPKVAWVAEHEADNFARLAKVLLPKDYVRLWLTGEHVGDMSDAAGTGWLNVAKRCWSDELLQATGLSQQHMPRLVEGTQVSGQLRTALATRYGMLNSVVVAGGAGDNAASACGMGTVADGDAFISLGTSGVLFAANDSYQPNAQSAVHAFCHALPDTWHQMGVILAATDALNWLAKAMKSTPQALSSPLDSRRAEPTDVIFLPYLGGERTPINDTDARGVFMGLKHSTDADEMTRAVLQGVAFAFKDSQLALQSAGSTLKRAAAIGGGAKSDYWLRVIANTLNIPLDIPLDGDFGASLGAARLGMIAAEQADPLSVCTAPLIERTVEPDGSSAAFAEQFERYHATYEALAPIMRHPSNN
ncbi:xylulokinase [Granulosicoccus antarcticus]|uniref:Xylulose kinase n=1 Tax=Granulosicoccus antarcticus IMCC3135 TaxID=1192854 RepID=A0A2Z2P3M0_9GAMM|nr:xylulokinase [Granulosicoccus antarcticus]ASJ74394.1 Xylulose kinase [Granulosicoccus antarcticus IMCC3135]